MKCKKISGATRTLGEAQGYIGLSVRDILVEDGHKCMVSEWTLSAEEISMMIAGHSIQLQVLGTEHPPVRILIGDKD